MKHQDWYCNGTIDADGRFGIHFWHYGIASKGEPSIVRKIEWFDSLAARDARFFQ